MVTAPVLTVRPDDDLSLASQIMLWAGIRHLPVVRDGTIVGLLSEGDILRHEAKLGARKGTRAPVKDAMSSTVETVDIDADVSEAAARMLDRGISSLPVVSGGRLL